MLSINNLIIKFSKNIIIDDFNLSLEDGEIFALIGKSGSGKTSILRFIAGLEEATKGKISLNDNIISDNGTHSIVPEKRDIGMLFQDYSLFPHMNVFNNIAFAISYLSKKEQKDIVKNLLTMISLENIEKKYPHELSGGEQQRVALARCLASKPKLLLLDEPFASLDNETNGKIIQQLRDIIKKLSITTIFVTHSKLEFDSFADIVGKIENKKLNFIQ